MIPTTMSLWSGARNISTSHTFTPITFCNCKLVCCKYKWKNINGTLNLLLQFLKITFSQFPGPRLLAAAWCWWCVTPRPVFMLSCLKTWDMTMLTTLTRGLMHTRWQASCLQSQTKPAPQLDSHDWNFPPQSYMLRTSLAPSAMSVGVRCSEAGPSSCPLAPSSAWRLARCSWTLLMHQPRQPSPALASTTQKSWSGWETFPVSSGSCGFGRSFFTQGWLLFYKSK